MSQHLQSSGRKKRNYQTRILHPVKISFQSEGRNTVERKTKRTCHQQTCTQELLKRASAQEK